MGFNKYSQAGNSIRFQTKMKYPLNVNDSESIIIPLNISYTNNQSITLHYPNCSKLDCIENYCTYICSELAENNNISKVKFNDKDQVNKYSLSSLVHLIKLYHLKRKKKIIN